MRPHHQIAAVGGARVLNASPRRHANARFCSFSCF